LEHGAPNVQRKILKLDPDGMFETIKAFYGTVTGLVASGNEKEWEADNGKNSHSVNSKKVSYSGNGKKEDIKVKQPLNG
jgi:hypothetical protein